MYNFRIKYPKKHKKPNRITIKYNIRGFPFSLFPLPSRYEPLQICKRSIKAQGIVAIKPTPVNPITNLITAFRILEQ